MTPAPPATSGYFARDHRAAALPDGDKPFVGQGRQGLMDCRHEQSVRSATCLADGGGLAGAQLQPYSQLWSWQ